MNPASQQVTLVVYDWLGSEPGPLAWVFPSLIAAREAVRALRNAARWLIVTGERATEILLRLDVSMLRNNGLVLAEG